MDNTVEKIANHIKRHDRLVSLFGMEVKSVDAGEATVMLTVNDMHLNAAGLCHGAVMFALADVAFALAVNTHGRMALALEASINYLRPLKPGSILIASAKEIHGGRRTAFYRVNLTNDNGKTIAEFKATAFKVEDAPLTV
jgi:acyl-CoA thioesterase